MVLSNNLIALGSSLVVGVLFVHQVRRRQCKGKSKSNTADNSNSSREESLVVGVLGAGAIGAIAGLRLLPLGKVNRVILVGRSSLEKALQANEQKLTISESFLGGKITTFSVHNNNNNNMLQFVNSEKGGLSALRECQVILIATKTVITQQMGAELAKSLPQDSNATILSLQNGLGNAQILQKEFQRTNHNQIRVLTTVVAFNAELEAGTTNITVNAKGAKLFVQDPWYGNNKNVDKQTQQLHVDRVQILSESWCHAGLSTNVTSWITLVKYFKLLANLTNPINALSGVSIPELMADHGYRQVLALAVQEGATVFSKFDHPSLNTMERWLLYMIGACVAPALLATLLPNVLFVKVFSAKSVNPNSYSSMLQDLERRRPRTEISDLSGAVEQRGNANGYATPVNSTLCRLVEQAERAQNGSPKLSSQELLAKVYEAYDVTSKTNGGA